MVLIPTPGMAVGAASSEAKPRVWRITALVFGALCCLYLLTGGGQGYSVDGTFSFMLAHTLAQRPGLATLRESQDTLRRWGPVVPLLGTPLAWAGDRLAPLAPWRDSVPFAGHTYRLYDWPVLGAWEPSVIGPQVAPPGAASASGAPAIPAPVTGTASTPGTTVTPSVAGELTIPLGRPVTPSTLWLVSFLSLAATVPDGVTVAEITLLGDGASTVRARLPVVAGRDTAEWAHDVPGADRPQHGRAAVAGHWPGNPQANLYGASLAIPGGVGPVDTVRFRYLYSGGRFHLRALALDVPDAQDGAVVPVGPGTWTQDEQRRLFARFGFSFLNAPLMALAAACLVPLAVALGYSPVAGALLSLGFGAGTMAWPYAKLDFSETTATAFVVAATALVWLAREAGWPSRRAMAYLSVAGVLAVAAAGAKYSAAWFLPLLGAQIAMLWLFPHHPVGNGGGEEGPAGMTAGVTLGLGRLPIDGRIRRAAGALALFLLPAGLAGAVAVGLAGVSPTIWAGLRTGLDQGWLNFPIWVGLYGLLLSPGKSVFLYAPPLVLAVVAAPAFVRRHRHASLLFVVTPLVYLAVFGSKGVWHGGGWGPRYLVPALPLVACLALPVVEHIVRRPAGWLRLAASAVLLLGIGVQLLGVAKHPNKYTVMFRDHILPQLADYGAPLGGPAALAYWRHFGGPDMDRLLVRPPVEQVEAQPDDLPRSLGYAFAETGDLALTIALREPRTFQLSMYVCDWDRRGRRQTIELTDLTSVSGTSGADGVPGTANASGIAGISGAVGVANLRRYTQDGDLSGCEYLTWPVTGGLNSPITLRVRSLAGDVPVLSGLFFDSAAAFSSAQGTASGTSRPAGEVRRDAMTRGAWPGRYGADGYALLAWRRGSADVLRLPAYIAAIEGGDRVWLDTGSADLTDTAMLYSAGFSPLAGHLWLLGSDAIAILQPGNTALLQRALASPPWRYLAGLEIHAPHPEYGRGLDFWPLLLRDQFRSHRWFMAGVWTVVAALTAGSAACALLLARECRRPAPRPPISSRAGVSSSEMVT